MQRSGKAGGGALTRRGLLGLGAAGAGALVGAGCAPSTAGPSDIGAAGAPFTPILSYTPRAGVAGELTFWHFWGSPARRSVVRQIVQNFQRANPAIRVIDVFIPYGDIWTKNIAAVTAGRGMADVIVEDRPQLRQRAQNNVETDLTALAQRDGIAGDAFWPFAWQEALVGDRLYGLPYETDVRVLYYNRAAMADAGLDPSTPPANWDELVPFADALDRRSGNRLERVAFYPLFNSFSLEQWAWNNGGDWFDAQGIPTLTSPPNVGALEFIKRWVDRYGKANWDNLKGTFSAGTQDGFMDGRVVTNLDIAGYTTFLKFFEPRFLTRDGRDLGYGVAPIPPAPGTRPASLSGGFALSVPRGAGNPDASWELIKYMVFVGQQLWARGTYAVPTVERLAREDPVLNDDANWRFFVSAMAYGRPGTYNPYYPTWTEVLGPATDAVLANRQSPQQALEEAQAKVAAEIARVRR